MNPLILNAKLNQSKAKIYRIYQREEHRLLKNFQFQRTPKHIIKHGKHFERALATQIIMLAPMAPHYASELWSKFCSTPNRLNPESDELQWNKDVLSQRWPSVDLQYKLDFTVRVSRILSIIE